jgi:hypothetical protein
MAFSAQVTRIRDRNQTKQCSLTCMDNDAAGTVQAYLFANAIGGMRPCYRTPTDATITKRTGPNSESEFQIEAMTTAGFTIRKLTAGAAAAQILLEVEIR